MKKEVKRLFKDFPNLIDLLIDMRKNKEMSYREITNFFNKKGYICSTSLIKRLYKKYNISYTRKRDRKKNSFFGKNHSPETINLISKIRKENGYSKGKNNPFYGKKGKDSPGWRGGVSSTKVLFYSSPEWLEKRLCVMERDGFSCLLCGESAKTKHSFLNVHHIIPLSINWDLKLFNENLITLCVKCHKTTFGKEADFIKTFQDIIQTQYK